MPPVIRVKSSSSIPASSKETNGHGSSPLEVFRCHGLIVPEPRPGTTNAAIECPWCGKEKFFVNVQTAQWDCKVCGESGNGYGFLRSLWKHSMDATAGADYRALAESRNLLDWRTPKAWGCCKSILTGQWLVPGHGLDGKLNQLYRWTPTPRPDKRDAHTLYCTTGYAQTPFGTPLRDPKKSGTYVCEGPWDGMALWEVLRKTKEGENGALLQTGNEAGSLYAGANVLATPGANLSEAWLPAVAGQWAALLYDSDHPNEVKGKLVDGAGIAGMRRAAQRIAVGESRPKELRYLCWGVDGFDPSNKSGTDVRDVLSSNGANTFGRRIENLREILGKVQPVPAEWYAGATPKAKGKSVPGKTQVEVAAIQCESWTALVQQWKRAMQWGEGLDRALSVMLASVTSTNSIGDQLWVMLTSPPSTGKSTLCEALSANLRHVVAKSTIRGFHSGYQTDNDASEDHSLLAKLHGKTLITKDGDTLLQSPNLGQILSEARDVYDRVSRTSYRNKASRDYVGISMTWILCGTSALRSLDTSELGERFIKCTIMDGIDAQTERDIIRKILYRQRDNKGVSVEESTALSDPDTAKAVAMTSGYVDYLGQWGNILLQKVNDTDEQLEKIGDLARFVAFLRARPSKRQVETVERELAARLASQLHRLATCLAVVLQRTTLDAEVMRRTVRCAMDTARGRTLDIVKVLARHGRDGVNIRALAMMTNQSEGSERTFLQMLRKLGAVELFEAKVAGIAQRKPAWRLSEDFAKLYASVASLSGE